MAATTRSTRLIASMRLTDQHVVAVGPPAQAIGEQRRMVERLGGQAVVFWSRVPAFARAGEDARAHSPSISVSSATIWRAKRDVRLDVLEVAELRARELVRRAVLVHQPRTLRGCRTK